MRERGPGSIHSMMVPTRTRGFLSIALLLTFAVPSPEASADRVPPEGTYERQSLDRALASQRLEIEPAPEGKILGAIHVVNYEVFGPRDGEFLRWFNLFHRTTRKHHVEREVLLRPGAVWNETRIDETLRKLRDPLFTTLVVIVPVRAAEADKVDLLVVTRDVWSLRLNSNYELQEQKITKLTFSLSENNFLGLRKHVALVFSMDQSNIFVGPLYNDKNIAGSRLRLQTNAGPLIGRDSGKLEGSRSTTVVTYPLWSLASKWGAVATARHLFQIDRRFEGTEIRTGLTDVPELDGIEWEWRRRFLEVEAAGTRSLGVDYVNRFTAGYQLQSDRNTLRDGFTGDAAARAAFETELLPRSERSSTLFVRYHVFTPAFVAYRNISTYDLSEDSRLGPDVQVELGTALKVLESETNHVRLGAGVSWTFDLANDGFLRLGGAASGRLQSGELIDNRVDAVLKAVTPRRWNMRLVARGAFIRRINEQANRLLSLGGTSGLRGYAIGEFLVQGEDQVSVIGNLEVRSMPLPVWFSRIGGLVFYDVGHVADRFRNLSPHQDVGVGFRMLLPQASTLLYRFDWAIPLDGPTAGLPGRFTAGVSQVF